MTSTEENKEFFWILSLIVIIIESRCCCSNVPRESPRMRRRGGGGGGGGGEAGVKNSLAEKRRSTTRSTRQLTSLAHYVMQLSIAKATGPLPARSSGHSTIAQFVCVTTTTITMMTATTMQPVRIRQQTFFRRALPW